MVQFNNKWYRQMCLDNGFNADNELSVTAVDMAREKAIRMKRFMDAKKLYKEHGDDLLVLKLDAEIERLDNERVEYMLDALFYAEVMSGLGDGYNQFVKQYLSKRQALTRGVHNEPTNLTPVEKRVSERWEQAMERMKG